MPSMSYQRFAGAAAVLAGIAAFLYAVAFIIVQRSAPQLGAFLSALFLTLLGLLATVALVGVYQRVRETDSGFALWALLLSLAGAIGSLVHGGYDLANAINPPTALSADLPNPVDPRGLLTFGLAGVGLLVNSWLIASGGQLPRRLGYIGWLSALLLLILYLGRLIILSPASPVILIPAVANGFVVSPLWYVWLGLALWRRSDKGP